MDNIFIDQEYKNRTDSEINGVLFFKRVTAAFIDFSLLIGVLALSLFTIIPFITLTSALIFMALLQPFGDQAIYIVLVFSSLLFVCLWCLILFIVPMIRSGTNNGQTLGKQLLEIKVINDDKSYINFSTSFLREFVMKYLIISIYVLFSVQVDQVVLPSILACLFIGNFLWSLWDENSQTLTDKILGLTVIDVSNKLTNNDLSQKVANEVVPSTNET